MRIAKWSSTLDFSIIDLNDYSCVLGIDFIHEVRAVLLSFSNDMGLAEGGYSKVVSLVRGKNATRTLSSLELVSLKELLKPTRRNMVVLVIMGEGLMDCLMCQPIRHHWS